MRILSRRDLEDILYGSSILGAGGGGNLANGFRLIDDALSKDKQFILVDLDDVPHDALVCTPYILGANSPVPAEEEQRWARLPRATESPILLAYRRFQEYLQRDFYGTIACELGGSNTAVSFYAAAMSGHFIIDADPAGRAVPEITHSTYYMKGLPAAPVVMANEFGESFICENVIDDMRSEMIVRALAVVSRHEIIAIDHALEMKHIRNAVIPGTISMAQNMGRVWRDACLNDLDLAEAIATHGSGVVTFRGIVGENDWKTENGFTIGNIYIVGTGLFTGSTYRIQLKNENLVGWKDDKVDLTIPDLICLIDVKNNKPVTNPNYRTGMSVAVVGLPAPAQFRTAIGLQIFGPVYAGLDCEYVPVDSRLSG